MLKPKINISAVYEHDKEKDRCGMIIDLRCNKEKAEKIKKAIRKLEEVKEVERGQEDLDPNDSFEWEAEWKR